MLIEFKVANFRSIREEQTFSLVAGKAHKELAANVIDRELPGLSGVRVLKGAAIFGANASGKSNMVAAMRFVTGFVQRSATVIQPGDSTGVEPFKLDRESSAKPSEFEVTFVSRGVRFVFGFAATSTRVLEEYLIAYPKGAPQRWYHRTFNSEKGLYEWAKPSTAFKHDRSLQDKTRENGLFLSVGPQFNHPQLTEVFNWFKNSARFILLNPEARMYSQFSVEMLMKPPHYERIIGLLRSADLGVAGANIVQKDFEVEVFKKTFTEAALVQLEKKGSLRPGQLVEVSLTHQAEGKEPVALDFDAEESAGTRRFFALLGPWIDILENGHTVFVDEIEISLHPVLVKELLKLVFNNQSNPKGAQVIFTTHNPILLDGSLMRRDQVWFTEKSAAGATQLYPLTDYQPRNDEALAKGYLAGRYGAIPFLPEGLKL